MNARGIGETLLRLAQIVAALLLLGLMFAFGTMVFLFLLGALALFVLIHWRRFRCGTPSRTEGEFSVRVIETEYHEISREKETPPPAQP
jgi:hypothetical protein